MSKVVINSSTTQYASCRIYIFNCTYNNVVWQDDAQPLISAIRDKCNRLANFTYTTIKVANVRTAISTEMEVHIGDVTYFATDRISANNIDALRIALQTTLATIPTFSFQRVDVVEDMFLDQPSAGYVFNSMTQVI